MLRGQLKTPLIAAFFCTAILSGCAEDQPASSAGYSTGYSRCNLPTTPIASVQGSRPATKMPGKQVTIQGVVTLVQHGQGLYVEEPGSDKDERTSNAIFVQTSRWPGEIGPGSWISAEGKVSELKKGRNSLTALTGVNHISQCSSGQSLPLTNIALPLGGLEREAFEGMRIHLSDTLTVTDTYQLSRGKISLAANGIQFVATETMAPGPGAPEHARQNQGLSLPVLLPETMKSDSLATGSTFSAVTGVMTHDDRGLRLLLQSMTSDSSPLFSAPDQANEGDLRVVGMNLHNFFNGDGRGGDFPTPRGAETAAEFDQQRQRIGAALQVLNPHVLAVMELENDGFGSSSAAADVIALAEEFTGASWQVARPVGDDTGSDVITVGLFYRDDLLEALEHARTLTGYEFTKSRQPLAQVFRQRHDGLRVLVVVNHFKSKGSCPDDGKNRKQNDGQGCWNPMRVTSARKMSAWVNSLVETTQTSNALILGDMNAYRREDPIYAIRSAGFVELMDKGEDETGVTPYSFVYFGQAGTLDYAFANPDLQKNVQRAFIWHVNAALPANMPLAQPWMRFSDHDPVVVDIRIRQSSTSD